MTEDRRPPSGAIVAVEPREYEAMLTKRQDRLTALLTGSGVDPDRFIGMTIQALAREPRLLAPDVDKESVLLAILSVAEMGLVPSGPFGGAYLVPFKDRASGRKKVQAMTDWRALIKMALESGQVTAVWSYLVYEGDEFHVELGDHPRLVHVPVLEPSERGNLSHVYAAARLLDGNVVFEVMTAQEVDHVRRKSRAAEDGPWVTDPGEMTRKTAVRRLFKYLPNAVPPRLAAILESEDRWEQERVAGAPAREEATVSARRARILRSVGAEPTPESPPTSGAETPPAEGTIDGQPADTEAGLPE